MLELLQTKGTSGQDQWVKAGRPKAGPDTNEIRGPRVKPVPVIVNEDGTPGEAIDIWEGVWLERFNNAETVYTNAGKQKEFRDAQFEIAVEEYLTQALAACKKMNIRSAKGIAMAFDRAVNEGSPRRLTKAWSGNQFQTSEEETLFLAKVRDGAAAGSDARSRLARIYYANELTETSYDVASYST